MKELQELEILLEKQSKHGSIVIGKHAISIEKTIYSVIGNDEGVQVVVWSNVTKQEIKIGFYDPNLKEKIMAAITLLS